MTQVLDPTISHHQPLAQPGHLRESISASSQDSVDTDAATVSSSLSPAVSPPLPPPSDSTEHSPKTSPSSGPLSMFAAKVASIKSDIKQTIGDGWKQQQQIIGDTCKQQQQFLSDNIKLQQQNISDNIRQQQNALGDSWKQQQQSLTDSVKQQQQRFTNLVSPSSEAVVQNPSHNDNRRGSPSSLSRPTETDAPMPVSTSHPLVTPAPTTGADPVDMPPPSVASVSTDCPTVIGAPESPEGFMPSVATAPPPTLPPRSSALPGSPDPIKPNVRTLPPALPPQAPSPNAPAIDTSSGTSSSNFKPLPPPRRNVAINAAVDPANPSAEERTIVYGMSNNELWSLLRRFNRQINHVLAPPTHTPITQPDLRQSYLPNIPYRSDTLKENFERVLSALGPPSVRGFKEFMALTDWRNGQRRRRTATYCAVYFTAWAFGYTVIVVGLFVGVMVCFPSMRRVLFPMVDNTQPAKEGLIGVPNPGGDAGDDMGKVTRSEQAEEQAFELRAVFEAYAQTVITGRLSGKTPDSDEIVNDTGEVIGRREPAGAADIGANEKVVHANDEGSTVVATSQDKQEEVAIHQMRQKRDEMVARMAKSTEVALGSVADHMEILQNAMSPPLTYPDNWGRFKLTAVFIVPPVLAIHYIPLWLWGRLFTFLFGAVFWGHELIYRGVKVMMRLVPDWQQRLDIRNTILSGTPTNAQLTLHILRVCEDLGGPLPAPPQARGEDSVKAKALMGTERGRGSNPTAAAFTVPPGEGEKEEQAKDTEEASSTNGAFDMFKRKSKVKTKGKMLNMVRKVARTAAAFSSDVAVDGKSSNKIVSTFHNMLLQHKFGDLEDSPDAYVCKLGGDKRGYLLLDHENLRLAWVGLMSQDPEYEWDITELVELQKDTVGLKRMAMGWIGGADISSLGLTMRFLPGNADHMANRNEEEEEADDEVPSLPAAGESGSDRLSISSLSRRVSNATSRSTGSGSSSSPAPVDPAAQSSSTKQLDKYDSKKRKATLAFEGNGETVHLSGVQRREELFNRLIAMGPQRWEVL